MRHFGVICPPVSGHIHPMAALSQELRLRGHQVTCFQMLDLEAKIRSEGMDYEPIGQSDHPLGSLPRSLRKLGELSGISALRFTIDAVARTSEMVLRDLPAAIARTGVDALLVDQMEPAGGTVAEHLGIPFVTVCNALALNRESAIPPPFTPWGFADTWWARARNRIGYAASDMMMRPVSGVVARSRRRWGLGALESSDDSFSKLAQICQMPRDFDFPRLGLPESFHYVGPLRPQRPAQCDFPWEKLDGRPLVYASLGTLQNAREPLFRIFAEACRGLEAQLVLSHGGGLSASQAASLPGNPLVVPYAPQWELLSRASLTITHAGLNTVLDSLAHGVPMMAIPITYEQPAIARRVTYCRAGLSLPLSGLTSGRLAGAVRRILSEACFRESARALAAGTAREGGVLRAADLIETLIFQAARATAVGTDPRRQLTGVAVDRRTPA